VAQLMVLSRYYSHAHVMLLGDENQAIREGTASWQDMRELFAGADECALRTSYRSSPEITELFSSLLSEEERGTLSSVRRPGVTPRIEAFDDTEAYLKALRDAIGNTAHEDGLCAIVADSGQRVSWLAKQLGDEVKVLHKHDTLPASGVVLTDLALAKGLEFDHVIIPDAQEDVYPNTQLARRRLYTAISRAMHQATVLAQGKLTPLLDPYLASVARTDEERS
jgi:DNA helicase-2/ATP-dependent DNA helicase PcrA